MKRILVTGAGGQIGTELTARLLDRYGPAVTLATDVREPATWARSGLAEQLDCLDLGALRTVVTRFGATDIFHLAAILSAAAEADPLRAYRINMNGLVNVLQVAADTGCRVFTPSSIAAFGPETPRDPAPQSTLQRPTTMYGVTKVAGELLCDYYHTRFGVDARGLRFPGLVSYTAPPGGGTTDYAVEIFHAALDRSRYTCPLKPDTRMDMMYMADAIRAIIELMEAPSASLVHRNAFNVTALQFTPAELADAIRVHVPAFAIDYEPDPVRQAIADSWPERLDDSEAREQWGWRHEYELPDMVADMFRGLRTNLARHAAGAAGR
ncbi:MAG: NAD-dependent epimerase/dehydratase family protein [Gemmatimonadota bacterium]|nr:NAD-dependent epimerase/dehydratase family protein [Gemmatimonadota bacterium]MDE2870398.1 NAD-dependent epimerase/dehydratase family protein [Gemmatimonadota bacterium]